MKKLIIIFLTSISLHGYSQSKYSLSDCITYTLNNQPSIKIYKNNLSISKEQTTQGLSAYLPQISGSATITDNMSLQSTIIPAGIFGPDPTTVQLGSKYNTLATIDVSQTIYDQSKIVAIKAGKPYKENAALEIEQNIETIIYNTSSLFFQVLIYQEQLEILKANKVKYEEMHKVLKFQNVKGVVLEKDVDRVQVNLNSVNYQIQDATTKLQLSYNQLKNAMGMPMDTQLIIDNTSEYEEYLSDDLSNLNIENLIGYKLTENSIVIQEFNLKSKKAAYYPTLSAVGRFGSQALSNDFSGAFDRWNEVSYVGLTLDVPIFSGFKKRSLINEEKLKLENQVANFNIQKDNMKLSFENAKTSRGTAYSSFMRNKDNMVLAKKVLDVTDYQYKSGTADLTDFLNDDTAYKNSQSDYLSSLYNLLISELNYQKSKGTINEFINKIK